MLDPWSLQFDLCLDLNAQSLLALTIIVAAFLNTVNNSSKRDPHAYLVIIATNTPLPFGAAVFSMLRAHTQFENTHAPMKSLMARN